MKEWIAVALGGMLGALMRHALMGLFFLIGPLWLPFATLTANVLGCFAIGALAQWAFHQEMSNQWAVVGVRVGLLGGLTTFSSFALELVRFWQDGRGPLAISVCLGHLVLGVFAVLAGMAWVHTPAD